MQPDNSISSLKQGRHWQREGKLAEAEAAYRQATETNPSFFPAFQCLGEVLQLQGKLDEAICAYEQVTKLNSKALWANQRLGEIFLQQNKLDEAIAYFQSAIEINPDFSFSHNSLGECWSLQGKQQEAIAACQKAVTLNPDSGTFRQNLEKVLAKHNYSENALPSFAKTPQEQPSIGEVCEYIWKGLHRLGPLDESSAYCKAGVQSEEANAHFTNVARYTEVDLHSLTDANLKILKNANCSLETLDLIKLDNLTLEELYINAATKNSNLKLAPSGFPYFQQSILKTGYIYCLCPRSGNLLKSNQSIYLRSSRHFGYQIAIYRFVGFETFYLILASCHPQIKLGIYFPQRELVIRFGKYRVNLSVCINDLKSKVVGSWKEFSLYINNSIAKKKIAILGFNNNLGHYFWNDISGLQYLMDISEQSGLDGVGVADDSVIDINDFFPELVANNISKSIICREDNHPNSLFKTILNHNWMAFNITAAQIPESLALRLQKYSKLKCAPGFLRTVEEAQHHFPLLWITIRTHKRSWLSQLESIPKIINELYKDYPNLAVVFDGMPRERVNFEKIISKIDNNTTVYNALNCSIPETLVWANAIDMFIAPVGAGTIFTSITNKTGVFHTNTAWFPENPICLNPRENCVLAVNISKEHIVDIDNSMASTRSYDCNWEIIYKEALSIIKKLKSA